MIWLDIKSSELCALSVIRKQSRTPVNMSLLDLNKTIKKLEDILDPKWERKTPHLNTMIRLVRPSASVPGLRTWRHNWAISVEDILDMSEDEAKELFKKGYKGVCDVVYHCERGLVCDYGAMLLILQDKKNFDLIQELIDSYHMSVAAIYAVKKRKVDTAYMIAEDWEDAVNNLAILARAKMQLIHEYFIWLDTMGREDLVFWLHRKITSWLCGPDCCPDRAGFREHFPDGEAGYCLITLEAVTYSFMKYYENLEEHEDVDMSLGRLAICRERAVSRKLVF